VAVLTSSNEIRAQIFGYESANTMGFGFETQGTMDVVVGAPWDIPLNALFIGSSGFHPSSRSLSLDPADLSTWGEPTLPPATTGIKIFLDTATARWRILVDGDWRPEILISASDVISNLQTEGFVSDSGAMPDYLLDRIGGIYRDVGAASAVGTSRPCVSVVAADFDNDMDLDIYLVCTDSAHNLPNVLLENNGTGLFTEVPGAAGAVGSSLGRGESAAVADYDSNGFLDILVTNGRGGPTLNFDGPTELFHNMGNNNHWLEIELVGVSSNADGIGTVVFVDAGGKRQVRLQGGGMHLYSQDHSRLHFGLAGNTVIDQIQIHWPNGLQQTLTNIPADQIMKITEADVDTDNDGFLDGMEIAAGYDPFDDTSFPVWGDINDDRVVNTVDVLLATRATIGMLTLTDAELARGNVAPLVNGKPQPPAVGVFNLADLLLIERKALGVITF
jgi:hypothetical protein